MTENASWIRELAEWQGSVNATMKGLAHNQDEIDRKVDAIWKSHTACREQVLTSLATLEANAKNAGRQQGLLVGGLVSIIVGIVVTAINFLIFSA